MEPKQEKDSFCFTYSAKEQEELKEIRQKYAPQEESKMDKLRRMDHQVTQKATMVSLVIGVLGALLLGSGMSLSMTELGANLGMTGTVGMLVGCTIGVAGILLVVLSYPAYQSVLRKEREKIAPEVLKLTEELMK